MMARLAQVELLEPLMRGIENLHFHDLRREANTCISLKHV
jgi:hypothetical protein